jgi:ABC-type uncharacterized transport system substrate-binding protein
MMNRRGFLRTVSVSLLAAPLSAKAQQTRKVHQIGYLGYGSPAASANRVEALRAGLRDLGYVEGKNLVIEFRWSGTVEQMHEAAAELARMKVDIIFATSSTETEPARRATSTIPIVFVSDRRRVRLKTLDEMGNEIPTWTSRRGCAWNETSCDPQNGRPKATVKLTPSAEKPKSARNIAVRSRLKRSPMP